MTNNNPAFLALLRTKTGATSKELQAAMNRKWAPSMFQLRPIAERLGFEVVKDEYENANAHYRFIPLTTKAAKAPAKDAGSQFVTEASIKKAAKAAMMKKAFPFMEAKAAPAKKKAAAKKTKA